MSVKKEANGRRSVQVEFEAPGTPEQVWQALATGPGISSWFVPTDIEEQGGKRWKTPAGVSPLGGVVELLTENPYDALLRLDKPGPGIAALGAVTYPSGQSVVAMNLYMYGDQAAATVARETPVWQAWLQERFPMPTELSKSSPRS